MTSWARITRVASTGSTNADLLVAARAGAPHGTVLVAGHQSAGRGRFERVWESPPGSSVAISVVLRPPESAKLTWLPLVVGLAVREALSEFGVDSSLKWPNDVLIGGRKVCGILVERTSGRLGWACVAGLGINISLTAAELPVPTATSLALEGVQVSPDQVVAAVVAALGRRYASWVAGVDLTSDYVTHCSTIGREVRVQVRDGDFVGGQAVGISPDGCLLVEVAGGVREFSSGDVFHLR